MSDILCVTSRRLCKTDFLQRVEEIAACKPKGLILREKDMEKGAYFRLAKEVLAICEGFHVPCILHSFADVAMALGIPEIHLSLSSLRGLTEKERAFFRILGCSCHSAEEAREAQVLGCTYLIAGHVFLTDCKKGVPARGLSFLRDVCQSVKVPVYAIGGICAQNIAAVRKSGSAGAAVMSGAMECEDVQTYFRDFHLKS